MSGACWVGDGLVPPGSLVVAADDRGLTVGDGCFETMKVVAGTPFALSRHLRRLGRSCEGLEIEVPDDARLRSACAAVLAADPGAGRLRVTVTAGPGPMGSARPDEAPGPNLVVTTGPAPRWEPTTVVAVAPWVRNERSPVAGLKTTSYAENALALAWAHRLGATEALLANTVGALCEGTSTNVFVVVDGELLTPPLTSGCLPGITRELVLELADVEARERTLPVAALAEATEVFLTSSTRDVHPVHRLLLGDAARAAVDLPAPGPRTMAASVALAELRAATTDP